MKLLLLLLLFSVPYISFPQIPETKDSLTVFLKIQPKDTTYILALNKYCILLVQEGKMEEAKELISRMEKLATKFNYGLGFYKSMNMRGVLEYTKQNSEQAMVYFMKCNAIINTYKLPKKYQQNSLNNIGIIYEQMGDRKNTTKYAIALINFQEKNKLIPLKTSPYAQIGSNLKFYKKYSEALKYFNKALSLEIQYKNKVGIAIAENNIGNVYDDLKNYKLAINHFKKGLKYAEDANYKLLQTDLLTNIGRIYQRNKDYITSEKYLKKSEQISRELKAYPSLKVVCSNLGDLYLSQKKYILSENYYLEALALCKEIKDLADLYTANENLAELYEIKNEYKKAYHYKQAADKAKDSINNIDIAKNTENLLRKYESQKKEQQITTLSAQNTINNLQLSNAKKQKLFYILGISLLAIIGGLLYLQSKNRKKTNQELQVLNTSLDQANKTKARFFSILNHDLRSPVYNLIHFLHLQKESPELLDNISKKEIETQTLASVENLLVSMEDMLLWSKGQMENFKPQLKLIAINDLFSDTKNHFASERNLTLILENPDNLELYTDENYLKTIIRNLTSNAVKAMASSLNPTIIYKVSQLNAKIFIALCDNGKGAHQAQFKALYDDTEVIGIKTGLGLHLIRDLAKAINCKIKVESKIGMGTTFTLAFG